MENYMDEFITNINFTRNKPMRDVVYEGLKKAIIEGKIPAGGRIVEKEYADKLNISRTPIREALRKLEMEDLVEYIPRKGVFVKCITKNDVFEIYKIRQSLEILAIKNCIENITDEEIKEIEELLNLTEEKNKNGEIDIVINLFHEFNKKIYESCKMPRLYSMINNLNEYLRRFRKISISDLERREKAIKEHRGILDAVINKDIRKLKIIIEKHLNTSLEIVLQHFDEQ